jgi:hypothetical protein
VYGGVFDVGDADALRLFGSGLEHYDWTSWLFCWNTLILFIQREEICCSLLLTPSI